jgi:MFS family permease
MFNALSGLGGGGQVNAKDSNKGAIALYTTFSVVGFFAGTITNRLGTKLTLSFGGLGYCIYASALLCYNHTQSSGFLIFAGTLLGACAGLLWCAQGAVMMSYPGEGSKGKYISWFWMIFNLGAVIGSLIPLSQNLHSTAGKITDGTYVGFIVLMALGAVLAWFMVDSKNVERSDGSHVIVMKQPSWSSELLGLLQCLRTDYYIIAFFPMFLASNWFYTYQFNDVNLAKFDVRTRALNNTLYWTAQIVGAYIFGYALDFKGLRRTVRAKVALVVLFLVTMAIWGGGYAFQRGFTRDSQALDDADKYDFTSHGYIGPMFLYFFYGFFDAAWQTCVYWFMGSLTNNSRKLANFAGFYKGIQSAGAAIVYGLDNAGISYMSMLASNWGLLAGSLVIAAPVILFKVTDHVSVEQDLKFSDETEDEVIRTAESESEGEEEKN